MEGKQALEENCSALCFYEENIFISDIVLNVIRNFNNNNKEVEKMIFTSSVSCIIIQEQKTQLYHNLACSVIWVKAMANLSLAFLICKMGIINISPDCQWELIEKASVKICYEHVSYQCDYVHKPRWVGTNINRITIQQVLQGAESYATI